MSTDSSAKTKYLLLPLREKRLDILHKEKNPIWSIKFLLDKWKCGPILKHDNYLLGSWESKVVIWNPIYVSVKWRCTQLEMCFEGPSHSLNMCIWRNAQNTQVVCSLAFAHVLHSRIIAYRRQESLLNKTNQQISACNMCRGKLHVAYRLLRSRVRITLRECLCHLYLYKWQPLRRADLSFRGIILGVSNCVWSKNLTNEAA
jgi:hypothetical protein